MDFFRGLVITLCVILGLALAGIGLFFFLIIRNDPTYIANRIDKALVVNNFEKAEELLKKMEGYSYTNSDLYRDAYYKVFNTEINYLLDDGTEMGVDRLVALIQSRKMGDVPYTGITSDKKIIKANERYNTSVSRHHAVLDNIISRAIAKKDRYLATSIVQCYRPILIKKQIDGGLFKKSEYDFSYSYEPKDAAEAKVNKAIKDKQL